MYVVLRADVGLAAATTDGTTVSDVWCVISWSLQTAVSLVEAPLS